MSDRPVIFEETQRLREPWLLAILGVITLAALASAVAALVASDDLPIGALALSLVGLGIPAFVLYIRLRVVVTDEDIAIALRPFVRRRIPYAEIAGVEARTYRPVLRYGGWGIRGTRSDRVYSMSGNQAVELRLVNGRWVLIGSRRPQELAAAIEAARSRVPARVSAS